MKKLTKLIAIFLTVFSLIGCSSNPIEEIDFVSLQKKLENKDSFILEIIQDGCSNCEEFVPKFREVLTDYDLEAFSLNLSSLSEEDSTSFQSLFNVSGTPSVIFIEKGEEESISKRIIGNAAKDKIISKLKIAKYID